MAVTHINTTSHTVVQEPNQTHGSEYIFRFIAVILMSGVVFLFVIVAISAACASSEMDNVVCVNSGVSSLSVASAVALALAYLMILRPIKTRSDMENKTEKLKFADLNTALKRKHETIEIEIEDERERRRIARKGEEADIDIRVIAAETTRDVMRKLADGVVSGSVDPTHYAHVMKALTSPGRASSAPVLPASSLSPNVETMRVANPETYKVPSVGGANSPVKGSDIQPRHLTCTLRSLREAVRIAEDGRPPTRKSFQAYGIKANEEIGECQKFLQDCGIMDANSGWGAWADGLDVNKLGRWVAFVIDSIERNGGEAAYRKAAQMMHKDATQNGLTWTKPDFE